MNQSMHNATIQNVVIERLKRFPSNLQISVGNTNYSKEEILQSVKSSNPLGKKIMDMQLKYLQDLASGKIYADE